MAKYMDEKFRHAQNIYTKQFIHRYNPFIPIQIDTKMYKGGHTNMKTKKKQTNTRFLLVRFLNNCYDQIITALEKVHK